MKKIVFSLLIILLLVGCEVEDPVEPIIPNEKVSILQNDNLDSDFIYWYGRHEQIEDQQYFYYTATGFKVNFTGRIVDITLGLDDKDNDIYFSVSKDGSELIDDEVIILKDDLQTFRFTFDTYDTHEIKIIKRSEPEDGTTSLVSLETNGEFIDIVDQEEDAPHFLLIGGSGISGHGALGLPGQARTTENSSSLHSFGYLTAAHFNGTYEFVSNSGWGLAFGFNDKTGVDNLYKAYDYIGIDANENIIGRAYDHEKIPDIIIINAGGNDYNSVINKLSGFEKEEKIQAFKDMVVSFILKLRADAPEAHIFWTMTSGSLNGTAASQSIGLLDQSDQDFVHVVIINQVGQDGDLAGANNHSSYETHLKSSQNLVDAIVTYTELEA